MQHADPIILGLCGRAGAGKSTLADYLCEHHGFIQHAFATPIKDMLCAMFEPAGIDHAHLFEPHLKARVIPELGVSARTLMQTLGTEWGRALGADIWIRHAALVLGLHNLPHSTPMHDRIILTDVRFPNEAAWVRSLGGELVHIWRTSRGGADEHTSERWADKLDAGFQINNLGTHAELCLQANALVAKLEGKTP